MSILGFLRGSQTSAPITASFPLVDFQRYFQLFTGVFSNTPQTTLEHPALTNTQTILESLKSPFSALFDDAGNHFDVGHYRNSHGDTLSFGEVTTHGPNHKGSLQYLYVCMYHETPDTIDPYFMFFAEIFPADTPSAPLTLRPVCLGIATGWDKNGEFAFVEYDPRQVSDMFEVLAYANQPLIHLLADIPFDIKTAAQINQAADILRDQQLIHHILATRTLQALQQEVTSFRQITLSKRNHHSFEQGPK